MKITMPFFVLLLTAIFLFLAATNIQGGWLYTLDALLWSAVLLAAGIPLLQLRRLEFTRTRPDQAEVGVPFRVDVHLENTQPWPLIFISFQEQALTSLRNNQKYVPEHNSGFVLMLKQHDTFQFTYTFTPQTAGVLYWDGLKTGSFGPLGLTGTYQTHAQQEAIVVLPHKPDTTQSSVYQNLLEALKQSQKHSPTADEISHFRPYQPGDTRRDIHWKNSARQQELIVRASREEPILQALIIVNTEQNQPPQAFYEGVKTAEAICSSLIDAHVEITGLAQKANPDFWHPYQLAAPQRSFQGARTWEQIAGWLATLESDSEESLDQLLSKHLQYMPRSQMILISRAWPAPTIMHDLLEQLAPHTLIIYGVENQAMPENWSSRVIVYPLEQKTPQPG